MARKGRLRWVGPKTVLWPERPAQWMLLILAAIESAAYLVAIVNIGLDLGASLLLNLVWFASMLVLSLLYRLAGKRRST